MANYDPLTGGGISMAPIRLTEQSSVRHDEPVAAPEVKTPKAPAKRKATKEVSE
nr:hypothetical protein [uncultured Gellertiella sp.]